jgi:hypothetical protein
MFWNRRTIEGQKFFKGTLSRLVVCGIAFGALALQSIPLACSAESSKESSNRGKASAENSKATPSGQTAADDKHGGYKDSGLKIETDDSMQNGDVVLTLGFIRDCGLAVHDLRELALNLFDECTRKHLDLKDAPYAVSKTVSETDIDVNAIYHPPRPAWIFFYIATLEPILQLFRSATTTEPESKAKLIVPASMEAGARDGLAKIDKLISSIDSQVERLNTLLDEDPNNSVEMAKAAVNIYNAANELDTLTANSYKSLRESLSKGEKETVGIE